MKVADRGVPPPPVKFWPPRPDGLRRSVDEHIQVASLGRIGPVYTSLESPPVSVVVRTHQADQAVDVLGEPILLHNPEPNDVVFIELTQDEGPQTAANNDR